MNQIFLLNQMQVDACALSKPKIQNCSRDERIRSGVEVISTVHLTLHIHLSEKYLLRWTKY